MENNFTVRCGDNLTILKEYPDNYFDSVVTDPPYGISFLGKDWDQHTGEVELYKECLRVLKPGGHLLAFSSARTYHKLATSVEEAGFEIRDQLMWLYASGFPKSQDVGRQIQKKMGVKETRVMDKSEQTLTAGFANNEAQEQSAWSGIQTVVTDDAAKEWSGWGSALKPAHEPIVMARKPLKQTIAKNCQEWGTGAINIDACRIPSEKRMVLKPNEGTFQCVPDGHSDQKSTANNMSMVEYGDRFPSNVLGEVEGYQKYFYCPKVSRAERHCGFDDPGPLFPGSDGGGREMLAQRDALVIQGKNINTDDVNAAKKGNNHPTVKPVALMNWLVKLVTRPGGHVLDPFNGSGSTGMACVQDGFNYTGLELDPKYVEISNKRIAAWAELSKDPELFKKLFEDDVPKEETPFERLFNTGDK